MTTLSLGDALALFGTADEGEIARRLTADPSLLDDRRAGPGEWLRPPHASGRPALPPKPCPGASRRIPRRCRRHDGQTRTPGRPGRRNPDANLVRAGNRHRHIFDPKDLRRPVPRAHNRFHPLNPFRPCRVPRQPLSWPLPGCSGHRKHVPPPHPAGQHRATSHQAGPALPAATNAVNRQPPQPPAPASHADRPDLRGTAGSAAMPADRAERRKCALR